MYALPLGHEREHRLFEKFADVSRATVKGTLVVGVVQGTLGGLFFWILGLNAAVFWGVIMTLLSLLPAVGSALIWGPAAIILLATGQIVKGIILLAAGSLIIGLVDNLLRPMLVGRDTQIPDYLILLATLGGLTVFGLSGFVIGPIIAALFLAVWDMFAQEYGHEDVSHPLPAAASHPDRVTPALSDDDSRPAAP
jgi:predicted PurR-regulated permease PerM